MQWLASCLDEDEAAAQDALKRTTTTRRRIGGEWVEDVVQPPEWRRSVWDPARVLREIDAKREVLAEYEQADRYSRTTWGQSNADQSRARTLGKVVRLLALPFADRPGYQDSWRP